VPQNGRGRGHQNEHQRKQRSMAMQVAIARGQTAHPGGENDGAPGQRRKLTAHAQPVRTRGDRRIRGTGEHPVRALQRAACNETQKNNEVDAELGRRSGKEAWALPLKSRRGLKKPNSGGGCPDGTVSTSNSTN
jgi:hypothetical protein